jgi:hypothetical protein
MYKDFLNLKIYDKKVYWKDGIAEIYDILTQQFKNMSEIEEINSKPFDNLDIALSSLELEKAIDKIILHWTSFLLYVSRVNFLINIVTLSNESRGVKKKEINEFRNTATSHIDTHLVSALFWIKFHTDYFYFKLFEIREDSDINKTIVKIYLNAFQSAVNFIDKKSGNGATKFSENYSLRNIIESKCLKVLEELDNLAADDDKN